MVNLSKEQTVTDHSWRVAVIARHLAALIGLPECVVDRITVEALFHDIDEVWTGDAPSQTKELERPSYGSNVSCTVVKAADLIEQYTWVQQYQVDRHGKEVSMYCDNMINEYIKDCKDDFKKACWDTVATILVGNINVIKEP